MPLNALDSFINAWLTLHQQQLPSQAYDPEWPSPCFTRPPVNQHEQVPWQPVPQTTLDDMFQRLSNALDVSIHPDIVQYYSQYWSDPLLANTEEGELVLLQVWSPQDKERLRENLIGHALTKRRQKQPLTLFFACTEPDDGIISLNNSDGSIWLEYPGKPALRQLAASLEDFLARLTPRLMS